MPTIEITVDNAPTAGVQHCATSECLRYNALGCLDGQFAPGEDGSTYTDRRCHRLVRSFVALGPSPAGGARRGG